MLNKTTINIAADFSRYPGGRVYRDGPNSGQRFRDEKLVPALQQFDVVEIKLDGTRGYDSSFLDEAFGGLVREAHFPPNELLKKFVLVAKDPSLDFEIRDYISNANE